MPTLAELSSAQIAAAAEKLPSTPQVYSRLNTALKDPDVSLDEIASLVRMDASLSARVMRLGNSVLFGNGAPVDNLPDAINRIGLQETFRLVGAAMSSQLYVAGLATYGVGGDELCTHSLTEAVALEHLCRAAGADAQAGYTLGLMRSVGRLVLQRIAQQRLSPPLSARKASGALVLAWERENFGLTHAEVALRLFQLWKFPTHFTDPVLHQYDPGPEHGPLATLLHLAVAVADDIHGPLPIEKGSFRKDESLLIRTGLTAEALAEATDATRTSASAMALMLTA